MKNNGSKTGNNLESHLDLFQVLDLRGNPLTAVLRYRENVIGSCGYLTTIDGKTVEAQSRLLMTNMRKMRLKKDSSSVSNAKKLNLHRYAQVAEVQAPLRRSL